MAFCLVVRREIHIILIRVFLLFHRGADTYECYRKIVSKIWSVVQYLMKANRPSQLKERA